MRVGWLKTGISARVTAILWLVGAPVERGGNGVDKRLEQVLGMDSRLCICTPSLGE
jgi:hypothetical protein